MYYWYRTDTGEFLGAGPQAPTEEGVSSTDVSPQIGQYYDFDTGYTKTANWTGTEWQYVDVD